tara:strand:+ start:509 stop:613 length:105 start_codon:yes stop_codon:yes gene_type:complete
MSLKNGYFSLFERLAKRTVVLVFQLRLAKLFTIA